MCEHPKLASKFEKLIFIVCKCLFNEHLMGHTIFKCKHGHGYRTQSNINTILMEQSGQIKLVTFYHFMLEKTNMDINLDSNFPSCCNGLVPKVAR